MDRTPEEEEQEFLEYNNNTVVAAKTLAVAPSNNVVEMPSNTSNNNNQEMCPQPPPPPPPPPPTKQVEYEQAESEDWMENATFNQPPSNSGGGNGPPSLSRLSKKFNAHTTVLTILGIFVFIDLVGTVLLAIANDTFSTSKPKRLTSNPNGGRFQHDSGDFDILRAEIMSLKNKQVGGKPQNVQPGEIHKIIQDNIATSTMEFENFRSNYESRMSKVVKDVELVEESINLLENKMGGEASKQTAQPKICNSTTDLRFGDKCIAVNLKDPLTKQDAAAACEKIYGLGANLITLNDARKEELVFKHIHNFMVADNTARQGGDKGSGRRRSKSKEIFFWIGLEQKRRSWWYPDGRKVDIQTDYFSLGAPSHPCVTVGPFDVRRAQKQRKMWITKSCRELNRFICEYPIFSEFSN